MGGHSASKSKQEQTTTTNTTTTNTVRDIGLTGAHAIDMAAILEMGGIEREQIAADTINNLIQGAGGAYQQLIGGASNMIQTGQEGALKTIESVSLAASPQTAGELNLNKALPYIAVSIALYAALSKRKRG